MRRLETRLEGPVLIEPAVHGDERGFFQETFRKNVFEELGVAEQWVQDNHSRSRKGVLRGMHFQRGMAKLVRCARGSMVDVLADVREGSPSFGEWESYELDDSNGRQLYAPEGFAHGFCVTSDLADVIYKCSTYYDPALEGGFRFNDPAVGIDWPDLELAVSDRDAGAPLLGELTELPVRYSSG
jgi:dTDP-4-dehydrorhamnose 3,5-epimerase